MQNSIRSLLKTPKIVKATISSHKKAEVRGGLIQEFKIPAESGITVA